MTFIIPRNRSVWVFGGAMDKFIDNAKYAFLYCTKFYKENKLIWLSRDEALISFLRQKGFTAYNSNSLQGIFFALTAKVYIFDNSISEFSYRELTGGAIRINLWHGVPLKKIMYDDKRPSKTLNKLFVYNMAPPSYVCTTTERLRVLFSSAFNLKKDRILIGAYHRTIPFFCTKEELIHLVEKTESERFITVFNEMLRDTRKKVIYMPTFRDSDPDYFSRAIPNLHDLNEACAKMNILFIIKVHRFTKVDIGESDLSNVLLLDKSWDVYPLLPLTQVLITDYSSIQFDYAMMNKPVIYYPFDLEKYISESRELYFSYDSICSTENQVMTINELLKKIEGVPARCNYSISFFDCPQDYSTVFKIIS